METREHFLFSFLTTEANDVVRPIHAKAMPVMLATADEFDIWLLADKEEALRLQRPLLAERLEIVAKGERKDGERLGFAHAEALTLGNAVAALNAYAKAVRLGIYEPAPATLKKKREKLSRGTQLTVSLLHRPVPVAQTPDGLRALAKEKPINPASIERYLSSKFGSSLEAVRREMADLAGALPPRELAAQAYALYEKFWLEIPAGVCGWGAAGVLDLNAIERLAKKP